VLEKRPKVDEQRLEASCTCVLQVKTSRGKVRGDRKREDGGATDRRVGKTNESRRTTPKGVVRCVHGYQRADIQRSWRIRGFMKGIDATEGEGDE
jgi:hypothetical protein